MTAARPGNGVRAAPPAGRGVRLRCAACGQTLDSQDLTRCPLCGYDFQDERITGADITPYARAYAHGEPGWARMCEWIWFAGWSRLKHIMLARASAASRQFAFNGLLLIGIAIGVVEGSRVGWQIVDQTPVLHPDGTTTPAGNGWFHVASTPPTASTRTSAESPAHLWWNPVHLVVATVLGLLLGPVLVVLVLRFTLLAATRAHLPRYRKEQRLSAALDYGLAWSVPAVPAAMLLALRPISAFGDVWDWTWYPSRRAFEIAAAVPLGAAAAMWLFWLICVASSEPEDTRRRVVVTLALGAPLILTAGCFGWWFGMNELHAFLFSRMGVAF